MRIRLALAATEGDLSFAPKDERALRRREMNDGIDNPRHRDQRLTVVPDGYLTVSNEIGSRAFAVEIDRATVEEKPFKENIRAYGECRLSGTYERRYGTKSLRVLWVVADVSRYPTRIERIER